MDEKQICFGRRLGRISRRIAVGINDRDRLAFAFCCRRQVVCALEFVGAITLKGTGKKVSR